VLLPITCVVLFLLFFSSIGERRPSKGLRPIMVCGLGPSPFSDSEPLCGSLIFCWPSTLRTPTNSPGNHLHAFVVFGSCTLRDRQRGALRRLGTSGSHPASWMGGLSRPSSQLLRAGSLSSQQPGLSENPFYDWSPGFSLPHGRPFHHRHGDRLSSPDFRSLLSHPAGHGTGVFPASVHRSYSHEVRGQIYMPGVNYALCRMPRSGGRLP